MKWFVDLVWKILGWFGWNMPADLPSYDTYCWADWYYRTIPGFFVIAFFFLVAAIVFAIRIFVPDIRKVYRQLWHRKVKK